MTATPTETKGLSTQSVGDLLKSAYALTHRIHAIDKIKTTHPKGSAERLAVENDVNELREDRDRIGREIARRCGEDLS